jgi:hypothetical protein
MSARIHEPWWLALMRTVLHHNPVASAIIASRPEMLRKVPRHKSLFYAPPDTGLAIGSLNSQFSANIVMDVVDQFAKHALKLKHYVRYVDDITVFSPDAQALALIPARVDALMQDQLKIRLHPHKTSINRIEHGFDALGYVIRPYARYLRRATVRNGFKKIDGLCRAKAPLHQVRQAAHSYFGIFSHATAWKQQGQLASHLHRAGYGLAVPPKFNQSRFPK